MSVHTLIYTFISSFIALFPVVNPIGCVFIINGFLKDLEPDERRSAVRKIVRNCLLIGLGSLAAGHLVLILFGLAIPVIQVGGGIMICKTGWDWLNDSVSADAEDRSPRINRSEIEKKLFYPISFPITIGAGSISVIFTLMANASVPGNVIGSMLHYSVIALVIAVICVLLYIFLSGGNRLMKRLGESGNLVINKLIAFITFCIGIQIILAGVAKIFHLSIL